MSEPAAAAYDEVRAVADYYGIEPAEVCRRLESGGDSVMREVVTDGWRFIVFPKGTDLVDEAKARSAAVNGTDTDGRPRWFVASIWIPRWIVEAQRESEFDARIHHAPD